MMKTNEIYLDLGALRQIADVIAKGGGDSQIVCGPPGVGKNFIFERAFKEHGTKWRVGKPNSLPGFNDLLRGLKRGYVLFLDECDCLFNNQALIQTLKLATDHTKSERLIAHDIKDGEPPFRVEGTIVMVTNKNLRKLTSFPPKVRESIEAMKSRCPPIVINFDEEEVYDYTCYLAVCEKSLARDRHSLKTINLALDYFARHAWQLQERSPRMLAKIASRIRDYPDGWERGLKSTLLEKPVIDKPPPKPYVIVPGAATVH